MTQEDKLERSSRRISLEEIVNSTTHGVGLVLSVAGFAVLLADGASTRHRMACGRLRHLRQHTHLPLPGLDAVPRRSLAPPKTCAQNLGPLGDLSADCGNLHAISACQLAGRMGMVPPRHRLGLRDGRDRLQVLVCGPFQGPIDGDLSCDGLACRDSGETARDTCFRCRSSMVSCGRAMYTVGVVFFASRKIPYGHAVWHTFVMAGSVCHYLAVLYAVVLPTRI